MPDLYPAAPTLWHRLRRPSTLLMLVAGLLAADPLRWLPEAWTGATLPDPLRAAAAAVLAATLLWRVGRRRHAQRREVEVLVLPPRASRRGG